MKLRIRGQSIRIRLDQIEVTRLADSRCVEQSTTFAGLSDLVCRVECSERLRHATATLLAGHLTLCFPEDAVLEWANSDQVGIESYQAVRDEVSLHILIEKDFECLHRREDEDLHAFPNPKRSESPDRSF